MLKYRPVPLPERTVVTSSKSGKYVYLTQKVVYDPKRKCSHPKRIAIGKLNEEGLLIPNTNYFDLFPEVEKLVDPTKRSDFISVGPHFVVKAIASQLQLDDLLTSIFKEDTDKILDVATYMMMTENGAMTYFEDYGYDHSLFSGDNFTDNTIGNLLKSLKVKDIDLFIRAWIKMHIKDSIYILYDSTNMNSTAGSLELAEYGHAKDDESLPQINLSLGYDQSDQTPLFYELYPGSIIDNTECKKMVERAKHYGCDKVGFILDRGYFSLQNIRYFERNGFDYLLMSKGNAKFIKEVIEEYGAVLKNGYSYYIKDHSLYGLTAEKKLFKTGKTQYIHLYYDGLKAEKEKLEINDFYEKMDEKLETKLKQKLIREKDVKSYKKYYRLRFDNNGYLISYQRKDKQLRELINKTGYFTIISSQKMDAKEALEIYRDRDAIEKVFRMEKSYLGCGVFRVHSVERLESKVFLSFIALIIRNEIHKRLKPLYQKDRKDFTVPKTLRQYERIGITKLSDDQYHIRYNLTKKQKQVIGIFGLKESDYKTFANKIKDQIV